MVSNQGGSGYNVGNSAGAAGAKPYNTCQKLASRAYAAANRLLLGQARRVRFKGRHQLDTVESKTNTSGIRWRGTQVEWNGLVLPARLDKRDLVQAHGLSCPLDLTVS